MRQLRPRTSFFNQHFSSGRPWRVQNPRIPGPAFGYSSGPNLRVLYTIMGINGLVFCGWSSISNWSEKQFMINNFTMSEKGVLRDHRYHTIITHFFSHQEFFHLASNMFSLYFFGSDAILTLGANRFLTLYMGGGLISAAATFLIPRILEEMRGNNKMERWYQNAQSSMRLNLGASGAVSAVVVLGIILNPYRTIFVFPLPVPLPAWFVGVGFVGQDVWGALHQEGSRVGHSAHLGGAIYGALYYLLLRRRR